MYNWINSSATVTNCTFTGNAGTHGGGMLNSNSSPTVTNGRFQGNTAYEGNGGGMRNEGSSSPTITNSLYCENTPDDIWGDWDGDDNTFCPLCDGHVNNDGVVNTSDFLALLAAWGSCPAPPAICLADFDDSGDVGATDFMALLANWGPCQ
jgi:hypothetical protein